MAITREEFTKIYESHRDFVYETAYRYLKQREYADDVTQDVFLYIYNRKNFDINSIVGVKSYLGAITMYVAIKQNNRFDKRNEIIKEILRYKDIKEIYYTSTDAYDILKYLMNTMQGTKGIIFRLSRTDEIPNKDIAEKIGVSVQTVHNNITMATKDIYDYFDANVKKRKNKKVLEDIDMI